MNTCWAEIDFSRKEPGLLGDMIGSRKGTEKQKVNLEYLSVPKSKQVLQQVIGSRGRGFDPWLGN